MYLLTLFTYFTYSPPTASGNHQFVLCNYKLACFVLDSKYEIILYLPLSVWLTAFNIMPSGSIHVVTNSRFSLDKYSEFALLYHMIVLFFSFLRIFHSVTFCYNACTSLHSHWQCTKIPFSRRLYQLLSFFMIAILTGVRWYLIVCVCVF